MESYLFSFQMMHTSQFHKIDPYDWFCAPGSHMSYYSNRWCWDVLLCLKVISEPSTQRTASSVWRQEPPSRPTRTQWPPSTRTPSSPTWRRPATAGFTGRAWMRICRPARRWPPGRTGRGRRRTVRSRLIQSPPHNLTLLQHVLSVCVFPGNRTHDLLRC